MNFEKYIGIPYAEKGRDETGLDCYGLVRLIYKNEYKIDLPSFSTEYTQTDTERIEELIAQYKEGWESVDIPNIGDIVLFRIFGVESHIGLVVSPTHFIHVRENKDSVIESLTSASWSKRKVGFFKYSENNNAVLNAVPHPLKTQRYTIAVVPGTTITQLVQNISKEYNIAPELKSRINILINGRVIAQEDWSTRLISNSDVIEYRAVPTGDTGRMLLLIAVMIIAPQLAGMAEFVYMGTAGATAAGSAAVYAAAYATAIVVGSALVNAIAPIRPPSLGNQNNATSSERQFMVNGGSNRANPYGAIPVVLGKVRVTPLLGSTNFLTYENERDSFLSMLLVWGYGPLSIDDNSYKIGNVPLINYDPESIRKITLDRKTEPTDTEKRNFNAIYGKDITQVNTQIELVCDGNPEEIVSPGPWFEAATTQQTNPNTNLIDPVNAVTLALHFPQGLRYIKSKGNGAGDSFAVGVNFRAEYSTNGGSTWQLLESFTIGGDAPKRDGFTFTKTYNNLNNDQMLVRVRRETGDNVEDNPDRRYYFTSVLQNITFLRNTKPVTDPVGAKLAMTAFKINASKELNGNIEGISAVVQTWCKIWNGTAWVDGATSNPAALVRYILEHPANPRRITNAASQINLTQLQYFYEYCQTRGFEYNGVLGDARSVLEVIRDICAAGRASPALIDGKWTVIIDEVKSTVVQHFTPHNSYNFEGSKMLPKRPDGLRVTYYDQDSDYQESEIIVYDTGKGTNNATLFESITLPGVTKKSLVIDHAKWHMAQMKLRPEIYTLESDIEYLVCNRGDRVKVMHDIPMWGLGSGRVKNRISNTVLELDEDVPMKANVQYVMRFRSKTGASVTRNIVPKSQDGYYTEVTLSSGVTASEADALDLFLFGEVNQEAQDLIVLSIEPSANNTARLTMVDYGVTYDYNIFTDYLNLSASTVFESQITLPPVLQVQGFGTKVPLITGFVSDESVMERVAKGVFKYNINVSYFNASQLPDIVQSVEVQYDLLSSQTGVNSKSVFVPFQNGSANITDVKEGDNYKVRMRYVARNGKVGEWSPYSNHTVVGKINPPSQVTDFAVSADKSSGQLLLTWQPNPEPDVYTYEIRTEDANWGLNNESRLFFGDVTKTFIKYNGNGSMNLFIRAIDTSGNYSISSTSQVFTPAVLPNVPDIAFTYANSQTTGSSVTLSWAEVGGTQFDVNYYEVSYGTFVKNVKANTLTVPVDWIGDKTFTIKVVDIYNRKSTGYSETITKGLPSAVTGFTAVADKLSGQLLLSWNSNIEPDVSNYEVRTQDINWGVNDASRLFFGNNDHLYTPYSGQASVTFYIRSVDFYGNYSAVTSSQTFTKAVVPNVTNIDYSYSDTSLTSATVTLTWDNITSSQFDLAFYELTYAGITKTVKANNITIAADWVGDRLFTVKTVDVHGSKSSGYSEIVTKLAPNPPTDLRAQVVDNTVMLYWTLPVRTSLPIDHILIKRGASYDTATVLGDKKGEFTTINESTGGNFTYWLSAVDTEGVQSSPIAVTTLVSEPPDFVFHGEFNSNFSGTKSSATFDGSVLALPVNTTETFEQHFTTRGWSGPQAQVNAGFPIFIQPSGGSGFYEEVFDFGQPLASSRVLLNFTGNVIAGSPVVVPKISLSLDNSTYIDYNGVTDVFGLNFRYVKVRITVTEATNVGLYEIAELTVRLDAKLKNDAGGVAAVSTDALGTIVNFSKEFIDVQSINVSPSATTPVIPVYDMKDAFVSGTYSVSSGVCTVTINNHGMITGQNVKLFINTGAGDSDIHTITSYSTNSFTVNMAVGNTSGNCSMYPQSFRVYLFNNSGTRVSANASWSIKGY